MPSIFKWSKTASTNANADPDIGWAEGMLPGGVNNSSRAEMAAIANARDDQGGQLTMAGTQPTYTLTTNSGLTALADGVRLAFVCHSTNAAGAATLNVDSLGAKAIRKGADVALAAGDLVANGHYEVRYDASANSAAGAWLLPSSPGAGETVTGAFALTGDLTPSQITADQNDYAPTGHATASVFRLSSDASRNLTGMAGGSDGLVRKLHNVGSFPIVLKDESASSTAANRFALAADHTLRADEAVELLYDSTSSRWRLSGMALAAVTGDSGSGGIPGLVPAPASGDAAAKKFLAASGLFAVPLGLQRITPFTASGTWTKQAGLTGVLVFGTGGGGGGGDSSTSLIGAGGGGSGGTCIEYITAASLGATETVTIGAAGTAGTSAGAGGNGGNTTFGSHFTAGGGTGGAGGATGALGGAGGTASGGDVNVVGASGGGGDDRSSGEGAGSFWGGGAGSRGSSAGSGLAATVYGSGGGGGFHTTSTAGGAGMAGLVVVLEFGG